tara:strand:- start:11552 stop:13711 length:2160 start_codon:yes stop_codon:yes gene_type:complete
MAGTVSDILLKFRAEGESDVGNAFKRITREARQVEKTFKNLSDSGIKKLRTEINSLKSANVNSISSMRAQKNALLGLRDMADVAGAEFKQLTADIAALDARMKSATATSGGFKGKLKGFAKGAGAIAAGGIFGGIEGAIGGGIGLALSGGNPAGAAVGAAVGAQVGMVRQQIAGLAEYSAALGLQRKALRLVIGDTNEYNKAQQFLKQTSKDLAIPQDIITRQFTSLTASVVGAGYSVDDAKKAFEAIAAGIRGTGGNLEDMKAAMRATAQVFSKGKVSAEELRQQLGERLPGAFTLFADSMDKTPAELDKALEQGKVTLDDFMKFASTLFNTYGENAKILAKSPEAAGDRLQTAMSELKDAVGKTIIPIGAAFQTAFNDIVEGLAESEGAMTAISVTFKVVGAAAFATMASIRFLTRSLVDMAKILYHISQLEFKKAFEVVQKGIEDTAENAKKDFQALYNIFDPSETDITGGLNKDSKKNIEETEGSLNNLKNTSINVFSSIRDGIASYAESIKDFNAQIKSATENAFKRMEDALVNFVMTGKLNFADFARSIIADITRIYIRSLLLNTIGRFFNPVQAVVPDDTFGTGIPSNPTSVFGSKNAMGNVYGKNGIVPFAKGGTIVRKPTLFPFANGGVGLMAEAGYPEAIMPLRRTKQGKLGVEATGGGGGAVVNVSVNAGGTNAEGNTMKANQLGKLIGTAIEAELIKQKRPGGILYS